MSSPRPFRRTTARSGRAAANAHAPGFTLVEMSLALLLLLLGAWLALLLLGRGVHHVRLGRFADDLQRFATAFKDHHRQRGAWPASTPGDGVVPRGMETVLRDTRWAEGSPFGGAYGWIAPTRAAPPGRITLTAFAPALPLKLTPADLREIDRRLDDGDLTTGRFRAGFNGWPVYQVEASR